MKRLLKAALVGLALCSPAMADTNPGDASSTSPLTRAGAAIGNGDLDAARTLLNEVLQSEPENVEALLKLGGVELSTAHYEAAVDALKKAASLDKTSPRPFIGLALAYLHHGDVPLAYASVNEALRRDPSKRDALQPLIERLDARIGADDIPPTDR